jgi:uncharacterized protein (DUF433 family)
MMDDALLDRITFDPALADGQPVLRGSDLTVAELLTRQAHGERFADLVRLVPFLEPDDLRAAALYAMLVLRNEQVAPRRNEAAR